MNEQLIQAQDVFLDKINHICRKFGLNNIMAQLYAILYFSERPLSLDDMVERLKISKGSVSVNIRALERYNAVRRVWVKGSRRDFYEAEIDISKVAMDRIRSMARNRLSEVDDMVSSSSKVLDTVNSATEEEAEDIRVFKERLEKLKGLQDKAQALFKLLNSNILTTVLGANLKKEDKKEAKKEALVI
ncbi:GbsR/MarR family transcriptional regulator [Candidatus Omnitrophota bacterium]